MSSITGEEPSHWHNADGRHCMTDPRKINVPQRYWHNDQRKYAAHLERHEGGRPERSDSDTPEMRTLFDVIEHNDRMNVKMGLLITALRQGIVEIEAEQHG